MITGKDNFKEKLFLIVKKLEGAGEEVRNPSALILLPIFQTPL